METSTPGRARPRFVDREPEIEELRRLADRPGPGLALLYGRRRVGKTYLLSHAWDDRRVFYYLAADTTDQINRQELLRELAVWSGANFNPSDYPTWRTVFRLFVQLAEESPLIVVLDEFQYLLGYTDDIVSQLVAVWDREVRDRKLTLALSGSEIATLERLQHGGQPLYGRPDWSARLLPFDYRDAAKMVPARSPREAALLYGAFGGTPRYLAAVDEDSDLARCIVDALLSPRGEVHLQLQTIIEQEKGIREPADYRAVLTAVAAGQTEVNSIALAAGLGERPYVVRRALGVLEDLELIWRERNFGAGRNEPYRYRISDNAVRFWYRFIYPNRGRLELGLADEVWLSRVQPYLNDYMGKVFERICRDAFVRYHHRWAMAAAASLARWEGHDRNRRSIEIDVVAPLDDGRFLTGEVKWSSRPVDVDLHTALLRDLDDLSRSGQGWAKDALSTDRSAGHIYFSAAGFTDRFLAQAAADVRIKLLTLSDLYPQD